MKTKYNCGIAIICMFLFTGFFYCQSQPQNQNDFMNRYQKAVKYFNELEYGEALRLFWQLIYPDNSLAKQLGKSEAILGYMKSSYYNWAVKELKAANPETAKKMLTDLADFAPDDSQGKELMEFCKKYSNKAIDNNYRYYVQGLSYRLFKESGVSPQQAQASNILQTSDPAKLKACHKRIVNEIITMCVAFDSYGTDYKRYPDTGGKPIPIQNVDSIPNIPSKVTPDYLLSIPASDGWGLEPYLYASNGKHYVIDSMGADGQLDSDSEEIINKFLGDNSVEAKVTNCYENDVIFGDGKSLKVPEGQQKKCR